MPKIQSPAEPIARGMGLDRPFFDDKNRAFWILQSIGWSGYFFLRLISGFATAWAGCARSHPAAHGDRLFADLADGLALPAADPDDADLDAGPFVCGGRARVWRLFGHRDLERRNIP